MKNKNFHGWLNRVDKNLLTNFQKSLEKLKETKDVKLNTKVEDDAYYYYVFVHEITSYKNLIYFRLYDLASSLIPAIENKNYTTAVIICRALFETNAMFAFRILRICSRIEKNEWSNIWIETLNFKMLPSWRNEGDIDWSHVFPSLKKFHINDAIRAMAHVGRKKKEAEKIEKTLFNFYSKVSEISHPTQANRQLYVYDRDKFDMEKINQNKVFRDNFSVNHADDHVFDIFKASMGSFISMDSSASDIFNTCMKELKNKKNEILKYTKSTKSKDDLYKINPVFSKIDELKKSDLSPNEIVNEIIKLCYKK